MTVRKTYESGILNPAQYNALRDVLERGWHDPSYFSALSGTGPVEKFEEIFAKKSGAKYALALSSCTAALHTALMALGIIPGEEVIVSAYSWGQSVAPVFFTGATAVFADIDPKTLAIDPISVESRISKKTRAIIPVHLFGNPADMDRLCSIAEKHGLAIVSDSAQAFGSLSKGREIGGLGDAACFSLGRGKGVCGGEGGVLVTNDRGLYERAIAISQHPLRAFREVRNGPDSLSLDELNWNYRIHPLAAVLALADLENAPERIAHRRKILDTVRAEIISIKCLESIQCYPGDLSSACGVPLTFNRQGTDGITRDSLVEILLCQGLILCPGPVKAPIYLRRTFQNPQKGFLSVAPHITHLKGSCPVSEIRCRYEELQLFEAGMLDKTTTEDAYGMIQKIGLNCERYQ